MSPNLLMLRLLLMLLLLRLRHRHVEECVRPAASTAAAAIGRAEYGVGPVAVPEVVDVRQREGLGGVGGVAAPAQRLEGFPQERVQPDKRRHRSVNLSWNLCPILL